jgi:curved DNA-binding protein CbpA
MQPIAKDFYSVLDIPPGTNSKEEIRQAYLRLARRYHPDVNDDPRSRERFEEINQAYTILSDDEARIFYNLYREGAEEDDLGGWSDNDYEQEVSLAWWQRNPSTLGVGLAVTCVLAAYGLVLYMPNFQSEAYTRSSMTKPERANRAVLPQDAIQNLDLDKDSKTRSEDSGSKETLPTPVAKEADPLTLETPARAYEMLAYYALVVGDLNQFKSALDLAHRADPSFSKINSLILSHQQLQSRKTALGNMLQSLRRQVIRENAARLTPSQLESLSQSVQNWQN